MTKRRNKRNRKTYPNYFADANKTRAPKPLSLAKEGRAPEVRETKTYAESSSEAGSVAKSAMVLLLCGVMGCGYGYLLPRGRHSYRYNRSPVTGAERVVGGVIGFGRGIYAALTGDDQKK